MDSWLSGCLCGYLMLLLWFYCDCRWIHDYQDACVDTSCCYCEFTVIVDGFMTIRMCVWIPHVVNVILLWFYCDCRWIHDYQDACVDTSCCYCDFTVIVDGFMTIRMCVWIPHVVTVILLWFYCDCRWIHDYQDACVDISCCYCDFTVIVDGFMTIRMPVWIPHVVTVILLWL